MWVEGFLAKGGDTFDGGNLKQGVAIVDEMALCGLESILDDGETP